jgi:hypothetical protein
MNFSKAGKFGKDHTQEDAYGLWIKYTEFAVLGEKALGSGRVLRILYEALGRDPEKVIRRCLDFLGEDFSPDCLLPLKEKINSSAGTKEKIAEPDPNSQKGKEANTFYKDILKLLPSEVPDKGSEGELRGCFYSRSKELALSGAGLSGLLKNKVKKRIGSLFKNSGA